MLSSMLTLQRENDTSQVWPKRNPLTSNVPYHIETSQLTWKENQLTSFYMIGNTGR